MGWRNKRVRRTIIEKEIRACSIFGALEESGELFGGEGVWAREDITTGGTTTIFARGAGKTATEDIDRWLREDGSWNR